jgi:hypothetical protein
MAARRAARSALRALRSESFMANASANSEWRVANGVRRPFPYSLFAISPFAAS